MLNKTINKYLIVIFIILITASCAKNKDILFDESKVSKKLLTPMGFTIQAGAFANVNNASRLTNQLNKFGFDATYFADKTGLFKVRFGNFTTKEAAKKRAEILKANGIIEDFYIVVPDEYALAKKRREKDGDNYLREELVKTAYGFLGVPYLWGGASIEKGFDCSGLTMTIYQLNGLNLPHSSKEQFEMGYAIEKERLLKGDLVFFATSNKNKVSHVGIYIGDGNFIHAKGKGKKICKDSLFSNYYRNNFIGAKTYL